MMKKQNRRWQNVRRELRKKKSAIFALTFLAIITFLSLAIVLLPLDPDAIDVTNKLKPASPEHYFGTDEMGRDYLLRVVYGGRVSLLVGVLAMLTGLGIGVAVGMFSAYMGGFIDNLLMRIVDVFSSIPWIIMVTVFSLLFKRGIVSIIIVIGLFGWMEAARLVRAEVLSVKEREFIKYAEFIGTRPSALLIRQILPAVSSTIITTATASIASAIMAESALSFLGLGVAAPMSSWGSLLQNSQKYLQKAPHMAVIPGILIILTVYSFNTLGDVFRVFVEPRIVSGEKDA